MTFSSSYPIAIADRLKGRVLAITGTDVPGRDRLVLERRACPDAQLADPAEIPSDDARCAVDLETVGVLLTHRNAACFQRASCARREPHLRDDVILVLHLVAVAAAGQLMPTDGSRRNGPLRDEDCGVREHRLDFAQQVPDQIYAM